MARASGVVFVTAVLLASFAAFASAQSPPAPLNLLGQVASIKSSDGAIDATQAQYEGTGLVFNEDGTVGVVLKGVPVLTVPGLNLNNGSSSVPLPAPVAPTPGSSPAVDLQVAATDLPGVISALSSLNLGRKLKL